METTVKKKTLWQKLDTRLYDIAKKNNPEAEITGTGFRGKLRNFIMNFTIYEILWMVVIIGLSLALSVLLPEEDVLSETTGKVIASGALITVLYFFDTIIGCFCELLFSKQNKWAFLIYDLVEVIEIAVMLLLRTRFASMTVSLFFWIPAHTAGFFAWRKHKDDRKYETTEVRNLKPWQTVLIMVGTVVLSVGVGYLLTKINADTTFYSSDLVEKISAYADGALAVMSILDGILMFFRSRESWWTWYIYLAIETFFNILNGQWVLLVYKFGYLTNGIYGNHKWTEYIKENKDKAAHEA